MHYKILAAGLAAAATAATDSASETVPNGALTAVTTHPATLSDSFLTSITNAIRHPPSEPLSMSTMDMSEIISSLKSPKNKTIFSTQLTTTNTNTKSGKGNKTKGLFEVFGSAETGKSKSERIPSPADCYISCDNSYKVLWTRYNIDLSQCNGYDMGSYSDKLESMLRDAAEDACLESQYKFQVIDKKTGTYHVSFRCEITTSKRVGDALRNTFPEAKVDGCGFL